MGKEKKEPLREKNVVVGNLVDKSELKNPLSRWMVNNFDRQLISLLSETGAKNIHEVGCGEGRITYKISELFKIKIRGTDLSETIISTLNGKNSNPLISFESKSIYDLVPGEDSADVILCCEVMEHIDNPSKGLDILKELKARFYVFSVPREPLWRFLNMMRFKYLKYLGNTPGHINHWSSRQFSGLLSKNGFSIIKIKKPLPWTMCLAERMVD